MFEDAHRYKLREAGAVALNWQRLYDWTVEQEPGAIVGESCTNTLDPLGNYLSAVTHTDAGYWSIGPSIKNGYNDRILKPDWVKLLIAATDRSTGGQPGPVTREVYLGVLELVRQNANPGE